MKHELIITADDYGMSPSVNMAIEEGVEAGIITSTNVMVNMPYCDWAVDLRSKFPALSIGIHFCITCGKPVLNRCEIPTLVQEGGEFYPFTVFRSRYRKGLISKDDILKELNAQYAKFKELCGRADYWNSHENIHLDFNLFQFFVGFAESNGIYAMRSLQRFYVKSKDGKNRQPLLWRLIEPFKHRLITSWQNSARKKGITSPQGTIVEMNRDDHYDCNYLFANIQWGNRIIAEYVVHPSKAADSEYMGNMVESRMIEYSIVTSPQTKNAILANNIELVNYSRTL